MPRPFSSSGSDHIGNICPSSFLPKTRGDVREGALVPTYRAGSMFMSLRDTGALKGRCGRCRFREIYGGSRSRAGAESGDAFASDPRCAYEPVGVEEAIHG